MQWYKTSFEFEITFDRYEFIQFTKVFFCTRSCSSEIQFFWNNNLNQKFIVVFQKLNIQSSLLKPIASAKNLISAKEYL